MTSVREFDAGAPEFDAPAAELDIATADQLAAEDISRQTEQWMTPAASGVMSAMSRQPHSASPTGRPST